MQPNGADFVHASHALNATYFTAAHTLNALAIFVAVIAAPWALLRVLSSLDRRARVAALAAFAALDDAYNAFVALTVQHPRLDAARFPYAGPAPNLTAEEIMQQHALFDMLTRIFARAHALHHAKALSDAQPGAPWRGWDAYIRQYCDKPNYRAWLRAYGEVENDAVGVNGLSVSGYDRRFDAYMKDAYKNPLSFSA